jgi:polysaccharide pyruvyl transferase CsaB
MRILVSGYYGYGNVGDEALLEVIATQISRRFPNARLDVLSAAPEETARRLGVIATPRFDLRAVRAAIERCDVLLSGGGGLLQNATSLRSLLYYVGIVRRAVRTGRTAMIFAQSVGPLDLIGRIAVREGCKGIACATVRDARSEHVLRALLPQTPVERTADLAFLYDVVPDAAGLETEGLGPESEPYAVISVRPHARIEAGYDVVARAVDRLAEVHGVRSAFVPFGGARDGMVATEIIRRSRSAPVLLPEPTPARAAAIVARAHVVIGMRLHALIFAARFAVPFLAVPYDPKVAGLCDDLAYPLPALWTPGMPVPSREETDAAVDRLIAERDRLADHLRHASERMRAAAERNFTILEDVVERSPR